MLQILINDITETQIIILNVIFLSSILCLGFNEGIQITMDGWSDYFNDAFNYVDVFMILLMIASAISKLVTPERMLPSVFVKN